jgi:hypothetical protein
MFPSQSVLITLTVDTGNTFVANAVESYPVLHYVQEHLLDLGVCSVDGQKLQHIEGREDFGRIS